MLPEAPFLFSVAALSVTLAGFAGLVAAFRRGADWKAMDVFRLREIAEFGLGNALITLLVVPLSTTTGDLPTALRICAVLGASALQDPRVNPRVKGSHPTAIAAVSP